MAADPDLRHRSNKLETSLQPATRHREVPFVVQSPRISHYQRRLTIDRVGGLHRIRRRIEIARGPVRLAGLLYFAAVARRGPVGATRPVAGDARAGGAFRTPGMIRVSRV
jgi:hypothetical protein